MLICVAGLRFFAIKKTKGLPLRKETDMSAASFFIKNTVTLCESTHFAATDHRRHLDYSFLMTINVSRLFCFAAAVLDTSSEMRVLLQCGGGTN